jgi:hypothetical protein
MVDSEDVEVPEYIPRKRFRLLPREAESRFPRGLLFKVPEIYSLPIRSVADGRGPVRRRLCFQTDGNRAAVTINILKRRSGSARFNRLHLGSKVYPSTYFQAMR